MLNIDEEKLIKHTEAYINTLLDLTVLWLHSATNPSYVAVFSCLQALLNKLNSKRICNVLM